MVHDLLLGCSHAVPDGDSQQGPEGSEQEEADDYGEKGGEVGVHGAFLSVVVSLSTV